MPRLRRLSALSPSLEHPLHSSSDEREVLGGRTTATFVASPGKFPAAAE